ncbi:MAG: phosphoglycerate kinase, partial [Deltaproteobacteria bacterium]
MDKNQLPVIQDASLEGKVVLVRVDHNVVKKGVIRDPYRIDRTIGT